MGTWYFHAYPKSSPTYGAHHAKGISAAQALGVTSNDSTPSALFGRTWSVGNVAGSGGYIAFPGNYNLPSSRARTYHVRVRPKYSTTPGGTAFGIFGVVGIYQVSGNMNHGLGLYHGTDGTMRLHIGSNIAGFGVIVSNVNMGTWNPTAGVAYDVALVWDGTTTANAVKLYVNGVLLGQTTPSQAWTDPVNTFFQGTILLGQSVLTTGTGYDFEEIAIGDGADFTLTGFTGSSRSTNLIGLPALEGISWPAVSKVKNDTSWYEFGTSKTGTRTDPLATQVLNNISFGAAGTEFTGNRTDADPTKVEDGHLYGPNGTGLEGSLAASTSPEEGEVAEGVQWFDAGDLRTGTRTDADPTKVADGEAYGDPDDLILGTLIVPSSLETAVVAVLDENEFVFIEEDSVADEIMVDLVEDDSIIFIEEQGVFDV